MGMNGAGASAGGKRRHRRKPVMAEINVTPMVDVMLVLLIIFMVSAPMLTVGVPIELPKAEAKSLGQDKEPLSLTVDPQGKVYLSKLEVPIDQLVEKLNAVMARRGGNKAEERIFLHGDKRADYGSIMKVMARLTAAGFARVALVTDGDQGS